MISHEYKCIFIHLPRVGGTSVENWICGDDWWNVDRPTKHLLASQAKEIYKDYWDEYFTFAFVRNPWARMVSMLKYSKCYGVRYQPSRFQPFFGGLDINRYQKRYGTDLVLEHDHRFYDRADLISDRHLRGQVYGNLLDEELDFVGKLEDFTEDCKRIQEILGIEKEMTHQVEKSSTGKYQDYYSLRTRKRVEAMYAKDIEHYGYTF